MHSQTWKQLERDTSEHYAVKRNIKRGADFGIEDTDVDVFPPESTPWGQNFIIDCKHDQRAEGLVRAFASANTDNTSDLPTVLWVHAGNRLYVCRRMKDHNPSGPNACNPRVVWLSSWSARKGTMYLDEWFDKLDTVYKPKKAAEFQVAESTITSLVVVRITGLRETLVLQRIA